MSNSNATVIISVYNQVKYIKECLDSVITQNTDFNYDILIGDDASTDGTTEILKYYAKKYPQKIKLILRESNVGAAKNYISLHNSAEGDIVFHFDGDDVMLPGKLQSQYNIFLMNPDVNIVFHRSNYFSDTEEYSVETGKFKNGHAEYFDVSDLALYGTIAAHGSYAYRRSSRQTKEVNREFMEWFFAMDSLTLSGKGVYINDVLMRYRVNPKSAAYTASKTGRTKAYNIYFQDVLFYFYRIPSLKKRLYANYLFTFLAKIYSGCGISWRSLSFLI